MGKRVWLPKGAAPDPRWPEAAADRLDAVRRGLATSAEAASSSAAGPSQGAPSGVEPSATPAERPAGSYGARKAEGVQPRGQPKTPTEELAALRLGRTAPAAFNLQRHAVMVCGRPVVVPITILVKDGGSYVAVGFHCGCRVLW